MKAKIVTFALLATAMVACNGSKTQTDAEKTPDEQQQEEVACIDGKWRLNDYQAPDSIATVPQDKEYILSFNTEDHTFGLTTDCNSIGGQYTINGDSLLLQNIAATQMECPEMGVEDAMKALLPRVDTYAVRDSVLLLRSDMRTMATFFKVNE